MRLVGSNGREIWVTECLKCPTTDCGRKRVEMTARVALTQSKLLNGVDIGPGNLLFINSKSIGSHSIRIGLDGVRR